MNPLLQRLRPLSQPASDLLKSLSHPYRLMICCQLLDGEMEVGKLETLLELKQPNLSRELGKLRNDGLIEARREGTTVLYRLADKRIFWVLDGLKSAMSGLDFEEERHGKRPPLSRPKPHTGGAVFAQILKSTHLDDA